MRVHIITYNLNYFREPPRGGVLYGRTEATRFPENFSFLFFLFIYKWSWISHFLVTSRYFRHIKTTVSY